MRETFILLVAISILSSCEKYTDATSPCFGKDGKPMVGRSAAAPLTVVASTPPRKKCDFESLGDEP